MPTRTKTLPEAPERPKAPDELIASWRDRREMYVRVFESLVRSNALLDEGVKLIGDILRDLTADMSALLAEMRPYDAKPETRE